MGEPSLVVGASGLVGSALVDELRRRRIGVVGTYRNHAVAGAVHLDLADPRELEAVLDRVGPRIVYCPAAEPNVELCEQRPAETWRANVVTAEVLARALARRGTRLVYFSSDYVFDGEAGPYDESAWPRPISAYGRQKLAAEEVVRRHPDHVIVRTTVVYGWEAQRKNFVVRLVEQLRRGERARAPYDQVGSPTYAPNLAEITVALGEGTARGLFHVVGPETMDRHAFATLAARTFGLDPGQVDRATTAELGQLAPRPLRAGMDPGLAVRTTGIAAVAPAEGLRLMKEMERGR
jgi:dTDP-4-dehydrorhamnose reductase